MSSDPRERVLDEQEQVEQSVPVPRPEPDPTELTPLIEAQIDCLDCGGKVLWYQALSTKTEVGLPQNQD